MKNSKILYLILLFIGLWAMLGEILHLESLKGLGLATGFSPYPKVFCDAGGLEPFASKFVVQAYRKNEKISFWEQEITPQLYTQLAGPYFRRNVYGAAIAYAPRLTEPIRQAVWRYALLKPGVLREVLQIPEETDHIKIQIKTQTRGRFDHWEYAP